MKGLSFGVCNGILVPPELHKKLAAKATPATADDWLSGKAIIEVKEECLPKCPKCKRAMFVLVSPSGGGLSYVATCVPCGRMYPNKIAAEEYRCKVEGLLKMLKVDFRDQQTVRMEE